MYRHCLSRREALAAVSAGLLLPSAPGALARTFPERAVRIVALNPPGGVSDTLARIVGDRLTARWGKAVVIDNKVGAAGIIGSEFVASAPGDGHTLLLGFVGNLAINPALYPQKLRYDPVRDFAPISLLGRSPLVLIAHPKFPATSFAQLAAMAKRAPSSISYSSAGVGNGAHLAMEQIQGLAGIKLLHVPYKGGPQAALAVASGEVQISLTTIPTTISLLKNGQVRALAVSTAARLPPLPGLPEVAQVPTILESGLPGYEVTTWFGLLAPASVPGSIVATLSEDVIKVLEERDVRARIVEAGLIPESSTPEAFKGLISNEVRRWQEVVIKHGIKAE